MESKNKALIKISVLIDKMSVISESLIGDNIDSDSPDIEVLMQYNDKLQNLLKSYNENNQTHFTSATVAVAPVITQEEVSEKVPSVSFLDEENEEQVEELEEFSETVASEIEPIITEDELKAPSEEMFQQPEMEEVHSTEEEVPEQVVEEVQEVNQLFPNESKNVAESIETSEDINKMYETESAQDINESFTEESSSVEDYAESIQDQIMSTIKDLGTDIQDKAGAIGGIVGAGAAAIGVNKLSQENEEETIVESSKESSDELKAETLTESAPDVEETSKIINEELNTTDDSFFDFTEINLTESVNVEPELNDKFVSEVAAVEVSEKLKKSFAGDLKQNIDINDRFTFIQTLFNGDYSAFDSTIGSINKCNTYSDAVELLEQNVITKYRWNEKEDIASQFIEIIRQKFV